MVNGIDTNRLGLANHCPSRKRKIKMKLTKDDIVNELLIMKWGKIPTAPYKRYEQEALIEKLQLAIKKARERKRKKK